MTPTQRITVEKLQAEGFTVTRHHGDMVLMSSGADHRFVRADGSQKRANHVERGGK
jgi:hypothetical protein